MNKAETAKRIADGGMRVMLRLDGEQTERVLFFDFGAEMALLDELGLEDKNEAVRLLLDGWRPKVVRAVLWAGLLHEDTGLKPEDFNSLNVSFEERYELQVRLWQALQKTGASEEEIARLGERQRLADGTLDPEELSRALAIVLNKERLQRYLEKLGIEKGEFKDFGALLRSGSESPATNSGS